MNILKEFKEFAMKGNVVDLAIGVVVGGAFGKIVTSLVNDVIMPSVGILLGALDFSSLSLTIGDSRILYGLFMQSVVDFLIVAAVIFIVVRQMNRLRSEKKTSDQPQLPEDVALLTEIRDLLKK